MKNLYISLTIFVLAGIAHAEETKITVPVTILLELKANLAPQKTEVLKSPEKEAEVMPLQNTDYDNKVEKK